MRLVVIVSAIFLCAFNWLERPITITVPFSAGGPSDVIARNIEATIESHSSLKVAVINQGGASGNIGLKSFHQQNRGLLLTTENILVNKRYLPSSYPDTIVDSVVPVYFFGNSPYIVYAHERFTNFKHLVEISKTREILVGSAAPGSGSYETFDLLCNRLRVIDRCRLVIYKSAGDAVMDLIAGRLDTYNSLYSAYNSFTGMKTVNALTVLSKNRAHFIPEIPSSYELGYQVENDNWYGLFHKGLTQQEVEAILLSIGKHFTEQRLNSLGFQPLNISVNDFWISKLKQFENTNLLVKSN